MGLLTMAFKTKLDSTIYMLIQALSIISWLILAYGNEMPKKEPPKLPKTPLMRLITQISLLLFSHMIKNTLFLFQKAVR